jgi:uncharacterized protein YndB with AHSA1/START domain
MRSVAFDVPAEAAFDYLADPRNRPEWQSSLRRVELVDDEVRVGQRWVDVTSPGLRPQMETTALERPRRWAETGMWFGVEAFLELQFAPSARGCRVSGRVRVTGHRLWRPVGPLVTFAAGIAVPRDLARAARILSERSAEH